jgi:hypothetical protein
MARGKKEGFKGHVGAKLLRPKGIRERVKKKIARIASIKYGREINTRMVDECWKTYRREILSET